MKAKGYRRWISLRGALLLAAYIVVGVAFYTHRSIPKGDFSNSLPGVYVIIENPSPEIIPEAFRGETLTIRDLGNGKMKVKNERGRTLELSQRGDRVSFRENFTPRRNSCMLFVMANFWNEGRLRTCDDRIAVEGRMTAKGVELFSGPFKVATEWRVELKRIADASPEPQPRAWVDRR